MKIKDILQEFKNSIDHLNAISAKITMAHIATIDEVIKGGVTADVRHKLFLVS